MTMTARTTEKTRSRTQCSSVPTRERFFEAGGFTASVALIWSISLRELPIHFDALAGGVASLVDVHLAGAVSGWAAGASIRMEGYCEYTRATRHRQECPCHGTALRRGWAAPGRTAGLFADPGFFVGRRLSPAGRAVDPRRTTAVSPFLFSPDAFGRFLVCGLDARPWRRVAPKPRCRIA